MTIRYYLCPMDTLTVPFELRRARVCAYSTPGMGVSISNDVIGNKNWCLAFVSCPDVTGFAGIDGDSACVDVFEKLSDSFGVTADDVIGELKIRTLGQFTAGVRNRVLNRISSMGVDTTGLTTTSTLHEVLTRVMQAQDGGVLDNMKVRV